MTEILESFLPKTARYLKALDIDRENPIRLNAEEELLSAAYELRDYRKLLAAAGEHSLASDGLEMIHAAMRDDV